MLVKERKLVNNINILKDFCIILIFTMFNFWVNRKIKLNAYYMDDLYLWSFYKEQNFFEYVFPASSKRFRPIYWIFSYIKFYIVNKRVELVILINLLLALIIVSIMYFFIKNLSKSRIVAMLLGILFLASRFSYYSISQFYGSMEALALLFLLLVIINLYKYLKDKKRENFYFALSFYILLSYTHERFMLIIPIFILVLLFNKSKKVLDYLSVVVSFSFIQITRYLVIGTLLPAGTGGTNVNETFTFKSFFKNLYKELAYLFGFNLEDEYLNGILYRDLSKFFQLILIIAFVSLLIYLLIYLYLLIRNYKNFSYSIDILFLFLIATSLIVAAVTIRVEMRWIYSSYMLSLIYLAYMYGHMERYFAKINFNILFLVSYFIFLLPFEVYAHSHYAKIYLFENQNRYNSLAEHTYLKYKEDIFNKNIYIIGNEFKMSEFTRKNFLKVYSKDKINEDIIKHIKDIKDLGIIKENDIILKEDIKNNRFNDITDFVRDLRLNKIYGYYKDKWTDEKAKIEITTRTEGKIIFNINYPDKLNGDEKIKISYLDKEEEIEVKDNNIKYEIETLKNSQIEFDFESNFYSENAKEKRSENNLAYFMEIEIK